MSLLTTVRVYHLRGLHVSTRRVLLHVVRACGFAQRIWRIAYVEIPTLPQTVLAQA